MHGLRTWHDKPVHGSAVDRRVKPYTLNPQPCALTSKLSGVLWNAKFGQACPFAHLGYQRLGHFLRALNATVLSLHRSSDNDDFRVLPLLARPPPSSVAHGTALQGRRGLGSGAGQVQGERERGVDAELVKKVDLMNEDDEAYLNAQDRSEVACTA